MSGRCEEKVDSSHLHLLCVGGLHCLTAHTEMVIQRSRVRLVMVSLALYITVSLAVIEKSLPLQPGPSILCQPDAQGWDGEQDPRKTFDKQADFGYLREKLHSVVTVCRPRGLEAVESELRCSKNLEFCTATNLVLKFQSVEPRLSRENLKYQMDIFSGGELELSGCELDHSWLTSNLELMSPLQSWAPELRHLSEGKGETRCDVTIEEPTVIAKLDAGVNMYHHFCDFLNLYLSLHLNYSLSDLEPEVWDTSKQVLVLENIPTTVKSPFAPAWAAFTSLPLMDLNDVGGKVVCVRRAIFPLLARMVFGLYYNTPLVEGCQDSEMFRRFSRFMLTGLGIAQYGVLAGQRLRVTLLSRDTKTRKILNERDLVEALHGTGLYKVTVAKFNPLVPFRSQLTLTHNSDLLIGIHGAGLTHLLFLPDWAEVLELYNCDDVSCYRDLARLRGLGYTTHHWQGGTKMRTVEVAGSYRGPAHKKFSNYEFDPVEFLEVVNKIRERIIENPKYRRAYSEVHDEL